MKFKFNLYLSKSVAMFLPFISLINFQSNILNAEESYLKEIEIGNSTKLETSSSDLPTNPFEIVEMLRRANSMLDATEPSDAIDDALRSFNEIEEKENL